MAKASVLGQCDIYIVRSEELREYIKKKKASEMVEGGGREEKYEEALGMYEVWTNYSVFS